MTSASGRKTLALGALEPGMKILAFGNQLLEVGSDLAAAFRPGDSVIPVQGSGELLHIPASEERIASEAVTRAADAFRGMQSVSDAALKNFFESFAENLKDEKLWGQILKVNAEDVEQARAKGRSTTRLVATEAMRALMIEGLLGWANYKSVRGRVLETIDHGSWKAELVAAELGVVAFIFEGRPNVVADATGVLRSGNTVVFRIGRDALNTARAIVDLAVTPALLKAGLPAGAVSLIDSAAHAAGWALFRDRRLSLAVARGSGPAVATLGELAQSAGVPVSLHGTGGAWLFTSKSTVAADLEQNVFDSLDRKVCNTMNTCCILESEASRLVPAFLKGLERAGARRGAPYKLHVAKGSESHFPAALFERIVGIERAEGKVDEPQASLIAPTELGREWEWEGSPEVTVTIVSDLAKAVGLFNDQSPNFVAGLLTADEDERATFFQSVNAPFVGDGFTRWVDGQYALNKPELGLSNWENGRLFARGGVLTGDSVFTVRTRVSGTSKGKPKA